MALSRPQLTESASPASFQAKGYEMLELLGRGGMGAVYKARQVLTDRIVAIKVLSGDLNEKTLGRFQQEAHAACAFSHPNVVSIFDFGISANSEPFIVMEYLQGVSLAERLKAGHKLSESEAMPIFLQSSDALSAAHAAGVVHRDLKPANMLLQVDHKGGTRLKILDFGIAKLLHADADMSLTDTGEVFGSPFYMSPEQCSGLPVDARTDVYSLGCVMYETLTGCLPHTGENPLQVICKRLNEKPIAFAQVGTTDCSKELEKIVFKCLATKPEQRYQTMGELLTALETLKHGGKAVPEPVSRFFAGRIAGALIIVGIICGAAYLAIQSQTTKSMLQQQSSSVPTTSIAPPELKSGAANAANLVPEAGRSAYDYLNQARSTGDPASRIRLAKLGVLAAQRDGVNEGETAFELHHTLGDWLGDSNENISAAAEYGNCAAIAKTQNNWIGYVEALSAQGERICRAGQTEPGLKLLRDSMAVIRAKNLEPEGATMGAMKRYGTMLAHVHRYDEATKAYDEAIKFGTNTIDPNARQDVGYCHWLWGSALRDNLKPLEAQSHFEEALKSVQDVHWKRVLYQEIVRNCQILGDSKKVAFYKSKAAAAAEADPQKD